MTPLGVCAGRIGKRRLPVEPIHLCIHIRGDSRHGPRAGVSARPSGRPAAPDLHNRPADWPPEPPSDGRPSPEGVAQSSTALPIREHEERDI